MDYFEHLKQRLDGNEEFVPAGLGDKNRSRDFAKLIGVQTPRVFFRGALSDLVDAELPDEFVIKPSYASTSIGILLLKKVEDRKFEDILQDQVLSMDDILERYRSISQRYYDDPERGEYIVEQLLRDHEGSTPPQDIRFYTFQGEVGMILKEDHLTGSAARAMYFDGSFLPFSDVHARYSVADKAQHLEEIVTARTPANWRELLAVAKRVSAAVPSAFCRVDLYDTPDGVHLGEVTFYPGTFYYRDRKIMSQAEAERLGRLWDEAAAKLAGSTSGRSS